MVEEREKRKEERKRVSKKVRERKRGPGETGGTDRYLWEGVWRKKRRTPSMQAKMLVERGLEKREKDRASLRRSCCLADVRMKENGSEQGLQ